MLKICSIGCGAMAVQGHGPSFAKYKNDYPDTRLCGCCDIDEVRAKNFAEKYGFENYYTDYITMLDTEKPDVVSLISPVHLTCEMSIEIMKRGYNVILEKPPGRNRDELELMNKTAKEYGVNVRTSFNRRYTPLVTELKKRLEESGEKIINITCQMYRWHRYDKDFSTTAIHSVDVVKYIVGAEYEKVNFDYDFRPELGENVKNIIMNAKFENGVFAQITFIPIGGVVTERISVNTHNNTYFLDLPVWGNMDVPGKLMHIRNGKETEIVTGDMLSDSTDMFEICGFYDENRGFFEHVRNSKEISCDLLSAVQSVEIEDMIRNSETTYEGKAL